jgi:hypothetical protein
LVRPRASRCLTAAVAAETVCFGGETGEAADGFTAHLLVRVGARHVGEHIDLVKTRHRRAADARVGVLAREGAQRLRVFGTEFVHS